MIYCYPKFICVEFELLFTAVLAPLRHPRDIYCSVTLVARSESWPPVTVNGHTRIRTPQYDRPDAETLTLTTHNTHNRQPSMPRRDSNPLSQEAIGRTPTWPLGPVNDVCEDNVIMFILIILEVRVIGTGSYMLIGRVCVRWLAVLIYGNWHYLYTVFGRDYIRCLAVFV
jgi:hypothetical protein